MERLVGLCTAAGENEYDLGLLLVDLKNLRQINHQHAFSIGDAVLTELSSQLQDLASQEHTVFRISSHTFAVILPRIAQVALLPMVIARIRDALEEAIKMDVHMTPATLLFGAALNRSGEKSALLTLTMAERHLAALRDGHIDDFDSSLFEYESLDNQIQDISTLLQPFNAALRENAFLLFYQPKVSASTGELVGAEALFRWNDPQRGFVSPELAMQVAESARLIFDVTKWVVHAAARQYKTWAADGFVVPISVNIPPSILARPDLEAMLQGAISIWSMPAEAMTLEITEQGLVMDAQAGTRAMQRLRDAGFKVSIDDFGTGYSSLSYFHEVPATELKIDRSFVQRLNSSPEDEGIVRAVAELAKIFRMKLVAEGVEDFETLERLRELGCDHVQGFGVSRPKPAEQFETWAKDWRGADSLRLGLERAAKRIL